MEINKKKRFSSSAALVLLGILGVIVALTALYYLNSPLRKSQRSGIPIAKAIKTVGDTRLKESGSLFWLNITEDTPLYKGDTVFTGQSSSTVIEFTGGTSINLLPYGLVVIQNNQLVLETGNIEVDFKKEEKPLELKILGQEIKLSEPIKLNLAQRNQEVQLDVLKGKLEKPLLPKTQAPKPVEIAQPEAVAPKTIPDPIRRINLRTELDEVDFTLKDEYLIEFSSEAAENKFLIRIEGQGGFSQEYQTTTPVFNIPALPAGDYKTEIKGYQNDIFKSKSAPFPLKIRYSKPQAPVIKSKKLKLFVQAFSRLINILLPTAEAAEASSIATIEWSVVKNAVDYELEIYQDATARPLQKMILKKSFFRFKFQSPGKYFWRVRARVNDKWSDFSALDEIVILDAVTNIKTTLMTSPPNKQFFRNADATKGIEFQWDKPSEDYTYQLELFRSGDEKPAKIIPMKDNKKRIKFSAKDKIKIYAWRVRAVSSYGNFSDNEQKWNFTVIPDAAPPTAAEKAQLAAASFTPAQLYVLASLSSQTHKYRVKSDTSPLTRNLKSSGQSLHVRYEKARETFFNNRVGTALAFTYNTASSSELSNVNYKLDANIIYSPKLINNLDLFAGLRYLSSDFFVKGLVKNNWHEVYLGVSGRWIKEWGPWFAQLWPQVYIPSSSNTSIYIPVMASFGKKLSFGNLSVFVEKYTIEEKLPYSVGSTFGSTVVTSNYLELGVMYRYVF